MISAETVISSDQDLIASAQQGDTRAFGDLVCRHRDGVVAVVYRMCGDWPLAEELAQEAFIRAWQHLPGYKPGHSFRAWVYRIAINAALDALRRQKNETSVEDLSEAKAAASPGLQTADGEPEALLMDKERAGRVRRAVLALPDASRAVLVLREYGGLSYAEIAAAQGIPLGTVMSRLNSARAQLRQALAELMEVS